MKRAIRYLLNMFSWSVPGILIMSGSLPGPTEGTGSGSQMPKYSEIDQLRNYLEAAKVSLQRDKLELAFQNLTEANIIAKNLEPHAAGVTELLEQKKLLWDQYYQAKQ